MKSQRRVWVSLSGPEEEGSATLGEFAVKDREALAAEVRVDAADSTIAGVVSGRKFYRLKNEATRRRSSGRPTGNTHQRRLVELGEAGAARPGLGGGPLPRSRAPQLPRARRRRREGVHPAGALRVGHPLPCPPHPRGGRCPAKVPARWPESA